MTISSSTPGRWVQLPGVVPFFLRRGETRRVTKFAMPDLPAGFDESLLSLKLGAKRVLRDQRRTDSFQLREYRDHWTIQLDSFNPEKDPLAFAGHAVFDALHVTIGVGVFAFLGFAALRKT